MYIRIYRSAFFLFLFIILLFIIVQLLFRYEYVSIMQYQYLLASAVSNAFIITSLFAMSAAFNMISASKQMELGFRKVFILSFLPGFIAGILSVLLIFLYFNFADTQGMELLKHEYFDYSKLQAQEQGNLEQVTAAIENPAVQNTNILSWRTLTLAIAGIIFFNFSLAVMMAFLWKIKNTKK